MNNKLKTKDFILIALLTAVYMIIYMVSMLVITPLGALGKSGDMRYFLWNRHIFYGKEAR